MDKNPLILITNGYTVGMKDMASVYDWANKLSFDSPEYRAATVVDIKSGLVFGELETGDWYFETLVCERDESHGPRKLARIVCVHRGDLNGEVVHDLKAISRRSRSRTVPSLGKGAIVRLYGRHWQATDAGWEAIDNLMDNEAERMAMRRLLYPNKS